MGLSSLSCCCVVVDQFWHDEDSSSPSSSCSCGVQGGQAALRGVQGEVQQDPLLLQRGGDPLQDLRLQLGAVGVDQDAVLAHLAEVGPLAVNVDASQWHSYTGGIFDGCDYAQNMDLNHVVQMVGYTEDAWIVRNSWGTGW